MRVWGLFYISKSCPFSAIDTTKVVIVKATAPNAEEGATATVSIFAYDEEGVRGETAEVCFWQNRQKGQ
jgi:hypothetical protein